jgi:hypothetical protein
MQRMQMMGPGGVNRPAVPFVGTPQQGTPQAPQQPQPPPPPPPGSPPGTVYMTRGQLAFQLGQMMRAQVEDEPQPGLFSLRFGDQSLLATSNLEMMLGEQILVKVSGMDDEFVNLQLVRQESPGEMSEEDVSNTLMQLDVPPQDGNVALAKGMVEMGVPLTKQDFQELQQALGQMPQGSDGAPNSQDVTSAAFLKLAQLPMTPENITVMTNFMTQNPMMGAQLFEVSQSLKKLGQELEGDAPKDLQDLLQKVPGLVSEMTLTPGWPAKRKPQQNLHNMAFQAGIEGMLPFVNTEDQWELAKIMRQMRESLAEATGEQAANAQALLKSVEDNLAAQKLVNRAEAEKIQGLFYLQVPIRFHDEETTAEVRIGVYKDHKGEPVVDAQNLRIEVGVHTIHLGTVSYLLTIRDGQVDVLTSVEDEVIRELIDQSLPHLSHRLAALGYAVSGARCKLADLEQSPVTPIVQKEDFQTMARINLKA